MSKKCCVHGGKAEGDRKRERIGCSLHLAVNPVFTGWKTEVEINVVFMEGKQRGIEEDRGGGGIRCT